MAVRIPQGARKRTGESWGESGKDPAPQAIERIKDQGAAHAPGRLTCAHATALEPLRVMLSKILF